MDFLREYIHNRNLFYYLTYTIGDDVACHICKTTGIRTCDKDEAEIKCMICGYCDAEKEREKQQESVGDQNEPKGGEK